MSFDIMPDITGLFPHDHSKETLLSAQRCVSDRAVDKDDFGKIRFIGGVDQAFSGDRIISGIVVLDFCSLEVVERAHSILPVTYPYIPTFLSFREGPAIISAYGKLKKKPDLLMVDGAGLNHPRRAGLATHIGVVLDVPTIGITKKILCGKGVEPSVAGEAHPLVYEGKTTGWLLKSEKRSKPIIVAAGHRVSHESALSFVRACLRGYKLPEPVRLAHKYVNEVKSGALHL